MQWNISEEPLSQPYGTQGRAFPVDGTTRAKMLGHGHTQGFQCGLRGDFGGVRVTVESQGGAICACDVTNVLHEEKRGTVYYLRRPHY